MKWNSLVRLNNNFSPVCDIFSDDDKYWKDFIPHKDFYSLISAMLKMYREKEKSVWLQGGFGSGKTHATTTVKHLFSGDTSEALEYIDHSMIDNPNIRTSIASFREVSKTFPVLLKGSYTIKDTQTLFFAIQQEVLNAFKRYGFKDILDNSFEDMLNRVDMNRTFWEEIIGNSSLIDEVNNVDELLEQLKRYNKDILQLCEDELSKRGMSVITSDIISFLESSSKIIQKHGYSHLTLFWDEFTTILEKQGYAEILLAIQNISENIKNGNVFLYIVSHRTPNRSKVLQEDIQKIMDRFALINYQMEDVTTYNLLAHAIKKEPDFEEFIKDFRIYNREFSDLIHHITNSEDGKTIENIFNMLPIHPYTALILTIIARHMKSSERSIFKFLHSDLISKFLETSDRDRLVDIGYLWDFFYEDFSDDERLNPYVVRYETSKEIAKENPDYLQVLKAIVLLNSLNKISGGNEVKFQSILKPDEDNLKKIFQVTLYSETLSNSLAVINKRYIQKDVDGLFLISSATLPENEIENEKERLLNTYKSITTLLKKSESDLKRRFFTSILRETEIYFGDSSTSSNLQSINNAINRFTQNHTLKLMVFFSKEEAGTLSIKQFLKDFNDAKSEVIFIVIESEFGEERFNKFIDLKARESVSKKHNHEAEAQRNEKQSEKLIEKFLYQLDHSEVTIFHGESRRNSSLNNLSKEINILSRGIFKSGVDNTKVEGSILWKKINPTKNIPDLVFKSKDRDELIANLVGQNKPLHVIIKDEKDDYVLDNNLNIKNEFSNNFFVKFIQIFDNELQKKKSSDIHLGKLFEKYREPPYGIYSNALNITFVSILLKKYDGKLYEIGSGRKLEGALFRDKIVDIFKYLENKSSKVELRVRFGTEEEDRLIDLFRDIFSLEDGLGLNQSTFKIRDWISDVGYPLWITKYSPLRNEQIDEIVEKLTFFVNAHDDEITHKETKYLLNLLEKNSIIFEVKKIFKKELFESYFEKFLNSMPFEVEKNSFQALYNYIKSNIRANRDSDIAGWNEDRVKSLIMEWYLKDRESSKNIDEVAKPLEIEKEKISQSVVNLSNNQSEIEKLKSWIKNVDIREVIVNNIDGDKELFNALKRYFR
jgi:arsenate reductase-like glutaredoxin family protein